MSSLHPDRSWERLLQKCNCEKKKKNHGGSDLWNGNGSTMSNYRFLLNDSPSCSTYSSVQSATRNQDNNYGFPSFFPHVGLKCKLSKVLLGRGISYYLSWVCPSFFQSPKIWWQLFRLATPFLLLHLLSFPYPSRVRLVPCSGVSLLWKIVVTLQSSIEIGSASPHWVSALGIVSLWSARSQKCHGPKEVIKPWP